MHTNVFIGAVPQVYEPVGRLLDNHVVVSLVSRGRVVVVAEVAQPGALEVAVAAARLAALLDGRHGRPRRRRLRGGGQRVQLRAHRGRRPGVGVGQRRHRQLHEILQHVPKKVGKFGGSGDPGGFLKTQVLLSC